VDLTLSGDMGSLQQLLAALLPAGAQLGSLELQGRVAPTSALLRCSQLSSLTQLQLPAYNASHEVPNVATFLEALLTQAPRLASLTLDSCLTENDGGDLPACLVAQPACRSCL